MTCRGAWTHATRAPPAFSSPHRQDHHRMSRIDEALRISEGADGARAEVIPFQPGSFPPLSQYGHEVAERPVPEKPAPSGSTERAERFDAYASAASCAKAEAAR